MKIICSNLFETEKLASALYDKLKPPQVISLYGELGCGKTTFVKYCLADKVTCNVTSPTFNIVNIYKTKNGTNILHLDLYRIKSHLELYELGIDDFIKNSIFFVEWPSLFYSGFGLTENCTINIRTIANAREFDIVWQGKDEFI